MKKPNRDLLVLVKEDRLSKEAIEFELEQLHKLLIDSETVDSMCVAHEIADLNRYKMLHKHHFIRDVIKYKDLKPFVFLINKN
jgi:hypothetical protein